MSTSFLSIHPNRLRFVLLALAALTAFFSCEEEKTTVEVICEARCELYRRCNTYVSADQYDYSIEICEEDCKQDLIEKYTDYSPAKCEKLAKKVDLCHASPTDCDDIGSATWIALDGGPDPFILAPTGCEEEAMEAYKCSISE